MFNSGTKLVLVLVGFAVLLGTVSWWYRYEAAHRASQFWGPEASRLIAESKGFEAIVIDGQSDASLETQLSTSPRPAKDLSRVRGQAHLRHALMSDRNYLWDDPVDGASTAWRLGLRFYENDLETFVLLTEDFEAIGKYEPATGVVSGFSCRPMTASLTQYFGSVDQLAQTPSAASTPAE